MKLRFGNGDRIIMVEMNQRRRDIDICRAIAIFLIITHHVSQYMMGYDVAFFDKEMWTRVVFMLSYVNIPTFMFVAGVVLGLSQRQFLTEKDYLRFEYRKMCRLMIPFLAISFLQMAIKAVAPGRGISEAPQALLHMVIAPRGGAAGHLWFLYCLMSVFLVWPFLLYLGRGKRFPIVLGGLVILAVLPIHWPMDNCSSPHPIFGLRDLIWYLPIFGVGYWYGDKVLTVFRPRQFGIAMAAGVFAAGECAVFLIDWPQKFVWKTLLGGIRLVTSIAGAFFILWISGVIDRRLDKVADRLKMVGYYSYDIYLLHVALVGHPLAFLISKFHIGAVVTHILFVFVLLAAIVIPIVLSKVVRRWPRLAFVVLGVPRN